MAMLLMSMTVRAQDDKAEDGFRGHWFIQLQGGAGYTVGETSLGGLISPAAAFNFGYRFTDVWSLRAGLGGWQAKGALTGPTELYKYNYLQGNVDVMVDICSIFSGYRMHRAVSPYLFAGAGINGAFNNSEAQAIAARFPADGYLWDGSKIFPAGRFGVGTRIRITDAVQFNIEINANFLSDKFNSKQGSAVDWQLGAMGGFTFNIGLKKAHKSQRSSAYAATSTTAPVTSSAEPEADSNENAQVSAEPVQTVAEPESAVPEQKDAAAEQKMEEKRDVFFRIGRFDIMDTEIAKLHELSDMLKDNPDMKATITGYADPQTGSAKRNMYLSMKRAETVSAWLVDSGISSDRISVEYKGSTVSPYDTPAKNRVAICIVSDACAASAE